VTEELVDQNAIFIDFNSGAFWGNDGYASRGFDGVRILEMMLEEGAPARLTKANNCTVGKARPNAATMGNEYI